MELSELPTPISRVDSQLATLCGMDVGKLPEPIARGEYYLAYLCEHGISGDVNKEEIETIVKEYLEANPDLYQTMSTEEISEMLIEIF